MTYYFDVLSRMAETLSTSTTSTQEDVPITIRTHKTTRSQTLNQAEPRTAPPKTSSNRKARGNYPIPFDFNHF